MFLIIASVRNDMSAVALSVGLIIPRGQCVSGHVVRASSPPKYLDRVAWEDAVQGLGMVMSAVASEKNKAGPIDFETQISLRR